MATTVSTDNLTYHRGNLVTISVNVKSNGANVQGASVGVTVTDNNTQPVFSSGGTSDTNGNIRCSFRLSTSAKQGGYMVYASASKDTYNSSDDSSAFVVSQAPNVWSFTFSDYDLSSNRVDGVITWVLKNNTQTLTYNEGDYSLEDGIYTRYIYYKGYLINTTTLTTTACGNKTVPFYLPMRTDLIGYIAFNHTVLSVNLIENSNVNITFSATGYGAYIILVGVTQNATYVLKNGVSFTSWTYSSSNKLITITTSSLSTWTLLFIYSSVPPTLVTFGYTNSTANQQSKFYGKWLDDYGLSTGVFGTNNSGSWINYTVTFVFNPSWHNTTLTVAAFVGGIVYYRFWCNDTDNQWSDSGLLNFTIVAESTVSATGQITWYMRQDTFTANSLTAWKLDSSNSASMSSVNASYPVGSHVVYWGWRFWIGHDGASLTELTDRLPVCIVYRSSTGWGYQNATWTCPQTSLNVGYNTLVAYLYVRFDSDGTWVLKAYFTTDILMDNRIDASTWTVRLYTYRDLVGSTTLASAMWGDNSHASAFFNVDLNSAYPPEIVMYYFGKGELWTALFYPFTSLIGSGIYMIILFAICFSLYLWFHSVKIILVLWTIFGGTGGVFNLLAGSLPMGLGYLVLMFTMAGLLYASFR